MSALDASLSNTDVSNGFGRCGEAERCAPAVSRWSEWGLCVSARGVEGAVSGASGCWAVVDLCPHTVSVLRSCFRVRSSYSECDKSDACAGWW